MQIECNQINLSSVAALKFRKRAKFIEKSSDCGEKKCQCQSIPTPIQFIKHHFPEKNPTSFQI